MKFYEVGRKQLSNRLQRAKNQCQLWHANQVRRYTGERFSTHPLSVGNRLEQVGCDEDTIIAGYFHDVLEDTDTSVEEIRGQFGDTVAALVLEVTDVSTKKDGNRRARKKLDRNHLSKASSRGKSIKLADIIDNVPSVMKHDPKFASVYVREKRELLPVLRGGNQSLYNEVATLLGVK